MNNIESLLWLEGHIMSCKEIVSAIDLPKYPAGGSVGIAMLSEITRCLFAMDTHIADLKAQLRDHQKNCSTL